MSVILKGFILLCLISWCFNAMAAESFSGMPNLRLKGNVIENGCMVAINDQNKVVDLGRIAIRQLSHKGDKSPPVAFGFHLADCPAGEIRMTIDGKTISGNQTLLRLNNGLNANNVAIQITSPSLNNRLVTFGKPVIEISSDWGGEVIFNFHAYFIAQNDHIQPGKVGASATFVISYL